MIFILGIVIKCNGYEARQVSLLFFALVFVRSFNSVTVHNVEWHRFLVVFNKRAGQFLANRTAEASFPRYRAGGRKRGLFFSHPLNTREKRFLLAGRTGIRNAPLIYSGTVCGSKTNPIRELLKQLQDHCFHLPFFSAFANSLSWQLSTRLLSKTMQVRIANC